MHARPHLSTGWMKGATLGVLAGAPQTAIVMVSGLALWILKPVKE
jgi:hypothetical protein